MSLQNHTTEPGQDRPGNGEIVNQTRKSAKRVTKRKGKRQRASGVKARSASKSGIPERPFPRVTLEDAIKVPMAIRMKNGGNPWDTESVAASVGYSKGGNAFFYLSAASRDFGLTIGTRDTAEISLTELGRRLAYAETPEEERATRLQAFNNIELFKKALEYYNGSNLPEMNYLRNTLENKFGLDPRVHEEFATQFRKNCEYLNIKEGIAPVFSEKGKNTKSGNVQVISSSGDFVTVAEPETETGLVCFVAMPFSEKDSAHQAGFFAEVLRQIIAPAGLKAGFKVVTARKSGSDVIHATIVNGLLDADLVVVDLTEHNPNVLFELGMRMADDKPVALIRARGTPPIFDVDNMLRVEQYNPCLWPSTVEADLPRIEEHLRGAWENRDNDQSYMKILRSKRSKN